MNRKGDFLFTEAKPRKTITNIKRRIYIIAAIEKITNFQRFNFYSFHNK